VTADLQGIGQRFLLETFIARGAWGAVYRGLDNETGARVAVKRLHEHLCQQETLERFDQEARLLARIDSPHVVKYVAHGLDDQGRPFIVLEWLDGQDLAQWKRTRGLTQRQVIDAVRQAALGIAALHDAYVVHRDIKPSNFFAVRGPSGPTVKLFDVGVMRAHAESSLTAAGFGLGTPAYMSPEQARGQQTLTARSDLFSCGVMLFELLSGKKPYQADDMTSLVMKIVLQDPPRLRDVLPTVSKDLDAVVAKAMARNPDERFATGRDLAEALALAPATDDPVRTNSVRKKVLKAPILLIPQATMLTPQPAGPGLRLNPLSMPITSILEQRVVTAIFASFAATAEPGPAIEAFRMMAEHHGGMFHDMLGPRRVAVFGAAGARGDEAERAARTALQALSVAGIRMAIVTGQAVAREGVLSGGVIERGIREVERCRDEVRIDESTARFLEGRFEIEGQKGDRVLRPAKVDTPDGFGPKLLGQATPLVGRERECAALLALFEQCVSEPIARAALITGPAGTGKSRLCHEVLQRITTDRSPPTVLLGRGDPLSAGSPFGMVAPAIRRLAGIVDGEPLETRQSKLIARIAESLADPVLTRVLPFMGELARVPFADDYSASLRAARQNPMLLNEAMRTAWEDWITAECSRRPVVLLLEDLHWGDLSSIQLVDAALHRAKACPLMVLSVARPEVHALFPGLWAGRDIEEIRLGPLTRKASEKLVRHVLGPDVNGEVVTLVVDRADGNPFYLEELIRAVAEGGKDALPDTVLGMVQARLDSLGPEAKRLLRAASVFGQTFWLGGACALLGGSDRSPAQGTVLEQLVAGEVVVRRNTASLAGETEYAFTHALVRDAAYATLTDDARAEAHHLAGEWLTSRGYVNAAVLADHFARAGDAGEAREWYLRAAEQSLDSSDLVGAIDRAERGVASRAEGEMLGQFRLIQAEAHRFRGELGAAEARADEALSRLPHGSSAWLRAAAELAAVAGLLGHADRVDWLAREVNLTAVDPHLRGARVVCLCRAAIALYRTGHPGADALFAEIDGLAEPLAELDPHARGMLHFSRATRALYAGRAGTHLVEQQASLAAFQEIGDARNACGRSVAVGFAYSELGRYAEAEAMLRPALATSERMGVLHVTLRALQHLSHCLARLGQIDEACAVAERAAEGSHAQGDMRIEAGCRSYLAQIHYQARDMVAAESEARAAIALAAQYPALRTEAQGTLAFALLAQHRTAEALAAANDAHEILASLGRIDRGESIVRLALAEARRAAGDEAGAREATQLAYEHVTARAVSIEDPELRASYLAIIENRATVRLARELGVAVSP
jgi:eukaryotic-like serine/threonine-protein kinase